jgi:small nuclear ribonucleoprotein (snRNP)-like protein
VTAAAYVMAGVGAVALAICGWVVQESLAAARWATAELERREKERFRETLVDEPSRIVRDLFRERVVVTLKTGETFSGVLVGADSPALLLREAAQLAARDAVGIDGELIVPRADIAYIQRP